MRTFRWRIAVLSLLSVACPLVAGCGSGDAAAQARPSRPASRRGTHPNIVLVSIESLREDHVGCYGYAKPTTPFLDRLAGEGVRFHNVVSPTSWTLPAHASLFTGLNSYTHGLVANAFRLGDGVVTLAEVLKSAGYRTAGLYGGPYLHPTYGIAQGFETYVSCMTKISDDLSGDAVRAEASVAASSAHDDVTGPRTLERVTRWLDTIGDRPFFLFVHLWDPHYDYIPPERCWRIFDPDYSGTLTGEGMMTNKAINAGMSKRDLEHLIALYDGEIRFTDENLSKILAEIARRRPVDSSLVVVTADHGEEFFEHGEKGHQKTLYEEVIRVPLVVRWPGHIDAGRVVQDQVRLIDVMPTVLSLAGVPAPTRIEGRDVSPLLRGKALEAAPALCDLQNRPPQLYAVRTNSHMFIAAQVGHGSQVKFGYQFYDLERDPGERTPLPQGSSGSPEAYGTLNALCRQSGAVRALLGQTVVPHIVTDQKLLQKLKSLGYIGGGK